MKQSERRKGLIGISENKAQRHNMDTFKLYEEDFISTAKQIKDEISSINQSKCNIIESLFKNCNQILKEMLIGLDTAQRNIANPKVKEYSNQLKDLRVEFDLAKHKLGRSDLIGEASTADRQRMMSAETK